MVRKCAFLLVLVFLVIEGCGGDDKPALTEAELEQIPYAQREGLPEASGGFVLVVGGESITSEEVISVSVEHFREFARTSSFEEFVRQARGALEQALMAKVSDILLYSQAERDAGEGIDEQLERLADAEVRKFIARFGGDYAKAEEALKKMGMDWAGFKEYQKRMILSQSYVVSKLPENKPITYSELLDNYNKMRDVFFTVPVTLKFRLIDIQPARLEAGGPKVGRQSTGHLTVLTVERARELAGELVVRIDGGEDFGELAKKYSHGHRRDFGGLWKPVRPGSLAKPYDILAEQAKRLKPGEIAGPIEVPGHIFIMKLEEKQSGSVEPFEKVQGQIEAKIIFDRRKKAADEFSAKLFQEARLADKDEFVEFCLKEIYRISNR